MATIIKESLPESKGIIVFTHKEKFLFENKLLMKFLKKEIQELQSKYFFAMHWGHFHDNVGVIPFIDFHLAGEGTLKFANPEKNYHIKLCSRNFINAVFEKKEYTKLYDIINVSRPLRLKNLDQFFEVIRKIYDRGRQIKVLIVCPLPPNFSQSKKWFYTEIYDDYLRLFNENERKNITLLMLSEYGNPFQLSESTIADFMNLSKIFTLFSDKEGESRVVAEALLCGLPVVVKQNIIGGAKDYLDTTNSRLFNTLDEAADAFTGLLDSCKNYQFDVLPLAKQLSEVYTKKTLELELKIFFELKNENFSGQLFFDNLARKLPSHEKTLSKKIASGTHDDINTYKGFGEYLKYHGIAVTLQKAIVGEFLFMLTFVLRSVRSYIIRIIPWQISKFIKSQITKKANNETKN